MTMIEIHQSAIADNIGCYHEFLSRFSKASKVVYGFVEGKDDPVFYRGFIDFLLPRGWRVELWPAGKKDKVYKIHKDLDWRRFPKKRVCFFVDRDLSDFIQEKLINDSNIYVTGGYSIENDIVNQDTCERILIELCGLISAKHSELEEVCTLFFNELEVFLRNMTIIMAWILYWRKNNISANLSDIHMGDIFSFQNGRLQLNSNPKGKSSIIEYIHDQCNIKMNNNVAINDFVNEFNKKGKYRKFTRGKYIFWFLVTFCNSIHRDYASLFTGFSQPPKISTSFSHKNGMSVIGIRSRMPRTLKSFLRSNYSVYIREASKRRKKN